MSKYFTVDVGLYTQGIVVKNILSSGNTELYLWDVLNLDTKDNSNIVPLYHKTHPLAPIKVISEKLRISRLYCKCTRHQRILSPTAHVESCPSMEYLYNSITLAGNG